MTSTTSAPTVGTGTPELAAALLTDLYVSLRRNLQRWAAVTHQTPQPRMGYVGQHLVSVVTGYPGGRSGARGDDLKLPGGKVAEIKCCYRVDQLGKCAKCGTAVASIEKVCPAAGCGSKELLRMDDSKWLLTPKSEQELREMFIPERYYLVLFEFVDLKKADDINVQILEVDPRCLGFSLCMIDYYFNIRAKSASSAPFNLWPSSAKLIMMKPKIIYWSVIQADDTIVTKIFPKRDAPLLYAFGKLPDYVGKHTFPETVIDEVGALRGIIFPKMGKTTKTSHRRKTKLQLLQEAREKMRWADESLADDFARAAYRGLVARRKRWTDEFSPTL